MSSDVIVYGRSGCGPCMATRRKLDALGVSYSYKDVSSPDGGGEAEQVASRLGARRLPLVVAGNRAWSGFRPGDLEMLRPPVVGAGEHSPGPSRTRSASPETR